MAIPASNSPLASVSATCELTTSRRRSPTFLGHPAKDKSVTKCHEENTFSLLDESARYCVRALCSAINPSDRLSLVFVG